MTEVIILAQGTQQRMGRAHVGWKQLLPLPACGGAPILTRTLRQVRAMLPLATVTLVTWKALFSASFASSSNRIRHVELPAPGNSSLKGIARYLESDARPPREPETDTIVLLGDVVYSWRCLSSAAILARGNGGFVGTLNLSSSGGELWAVAWPAARDDQMMCDLRDALLRHPPFDDDYQPGQMRRWISGFRRGDIVDHVAQAIRRGQYIPVDDYTMDVDLPTHVPLLETVSSAAANDDAVHDMRWPESSPTL